MMVAGWDNWTVSGPLIIGAVAISAIAEGGGPTEGPAYKHGLALLWERLECRRRRRVMLARFGWQGIRTQNKVKAHAIIKQPRMRPGAWAKRQRQQDNTR